MGWFSKISKYFGMIVLAFSVGTVIFLLVSALSDGVIDDDEMEQIVDSVRALKP